MQHDGADERQVCPQAAGLGTHQYNPSTAQRDSPDLASKAYKLASSPAPAQSMALDS